MHVAAEATNVYWLQKPAQLRGLSWRSDRFRFFEHGGKKKKGKKKSFPTYFA